ncbi:MAG: phosphoketolase [Arenicella sp.]|jgi:phosphoketolase
MESRLEEWPEQCGVIKHRSRTRKRMLALVQNLDNHGRCDHANAMELLQAADVICNMAMWLTVHMTYAQKVRLDGQPLVLDDFKQTPQGHTGGALNMVPAYVGYMLANALTGNTRAWLMGQGHCVAAIDAVNVLLRNLESEQQRAYLFSDAGLSLLCTDYYGYQHDVLGYPRAPMGSHVNPHTGGGIMEGGYLGFAGLQYPHMPLPGQELVAFLSDGAFEEQRGSDWATRWWRGEDTGLVMPIMIANGRRIEQRTSTQQKGGVEWLAKHLRLNGFDPIQIDGRDPAAFAWAIITMSDQLGADYQNIKNGKATYPVKLPYAIAETIKGYGFPGAGTNAAHNLPLEYNPGIDARGRDLFNQGAAALYIPFERIKGALESFDVHQAQQRLKEKDHCLRVFKKPELKLVEPKFVELHASSSPMSQVDEWFVEFARSNSAQRFRVGNPDELRSNRFSKTLDYLKHRVNLAEDGNSESVLGGVISALNEEAVAAAAFANKQGVNLVVSYEAFAVKMLGAMRQEVIFARNMRHANKSVNWISVPVLLSSHTWENGKNEISHQDPTLCEAWLQEMNDVAPVFFPFDGNSAVSIVSSLYKETGRVATVVVAKSIIENHCTEREARQLINRGAFMIWQDISAEVQLITVGAYQLMAAQQAAIKLKQRGVRYSIVAISEPGRFRTPRDRVEANFTHSDAAIRRIIPHCDKRVFITHTHAAVMTGVLRRLDTGSRNSVFLGYENRGGTLDVEGMQLLNRQDPNHIANACFDLLK